MSMQLVFTNTRSLNSSNQLTGRDITVKTSGRLSVKLFSVEM